MTSVKESNPDTHDTSDQIKRSAESKDKPMERKSPQAPFALVGMSYLAAVAIIGLIIGLVIFALS